MEWGPDCTLFLPPGDEAVLGEVGGPLQSEHDPCEAGRLLHHLPGHPPHQRHQEDKDGETTVLPTLKFILFTSYPNVSPETSPYLSTIHC